MGGLEIPGQPPGVQFKPLQVSPVEAAQMQAAQATTLYVEVQLRLLDGWTWEEVKKDLGLNIPPRPEQGD
jgi:hypothetical protein